MDKFLLFATRVAERVVPDTCKEGILGTVTESISLEAFIVFFLLNLNFWESDYIVIFSGCFSTKNVAFLMRCAFPNTNSFNLFLNRPPRATLGCNQDRIEITQL